MEQKEEELQFAVGGAVADVARSGPLFVPSGSALESMRASAPAARREMEDAAFGGKDGQNEAGEGGVATVDALDYVLYQVGAGEGSKCTRLRWCFVERSHQQFESDTCDERGVCVIMTMDATYDDLLPRAMDRFRDPGVCADLALRDLDCVGNQPA